MAQGICEWKRMKMKGDSPLSIVHYYLFMISHYLRYLIQFKLSHILHNNGNTGQKNYFAFLFGSERVNVCRGMNRLYLGFQREPCVKMVLYRRFFKWMEVQDKVEGALKPKLICLRIRAGLASLKEGSIKFMCNCRKQIRTNWHRQACIDRPGR